MGQVWPPRPIRVASGSVVVTPSAWTPITFPTGVFTSPPLVVPTVVGGARAATHRNVTTTGCDVSAAGGVADTVDWVAIQY